MADRIDRQFAFLIAADGLKTRHGDAALMNSARRENCAERSWHAALWALAFCPPDRDRGAVLAMAVLSGLADLPAAGLLTLLPADQAGRFRAFFDRAQTGGDPEARLVRSAARGQALLQALGRGDLGRGETDGLLGDLQTGRFADLRDDWPDLHAHAERLLTGRGTAADPVLAARLRFLAEADRLKSVLRGTTLFDGSRPENSAEHSWHIALFALTLAEHALRPVAVDRVLAMLILHDLVEIDAGDAPIHGNHDPAALAAKERRAADRLFGLLPGPEGERFRALWDEFEAAESDDAVFAKSVDRVQPVIANLESGGGTWPTYQVSRAQLESRVGSKVRRGAPALWDALTPRIDAWFAANATGGAG